MKVQKKQSDGMCFLNVMYFLNFISFMFVFVFAEILKCNREAHAEAVKISNCYFHCSHRENVNVRYCPLLGFVSFSQNIFKKS